MTSEVHTLQEAADLLGVHYMTAYRYVRLGQLDAHKVGGLWYVSDASIAAFRDGRRSEQPARLRSVRWSDRLESRLLAGDGPGAWGVIESALAGGTSVEAAYLEILAPALRSIGDRWESGEIDVAVEHRASGIASRLIGRLGSRCVRRGRSRGTIILGAPYDERHGLPIAILADLLRLAGWEVSDLGADTPTQSFVHAALGIDDLVAIGISVTRRESLPASAELCAAIRSAGIDVPILLGGWAVDGDEHARSLGADGYGGDASEVVRVLDELSGSAA